MEAIYRPRNVRLAHGTIGTSRRHRSPFRFWACVVSLVVIVGSYVSLTVNAVAQNTVEEWTSADGRTRMVAFWYPSELRMRRDNSSDYQVMIAESGDVLLQFSTGDTGFNSRGLFGVYSITQNKLLHVSDVWGEDGHVLPVLRIYADKIPIRKSLLEISALGDSFIMPRPTDYPDVREEYLIDLAYEGDRTCDPHATAIYPTKHFNQKEFGRVLIRINETARIRPSEKHCEAWAGLQEQLVFVEAIAPRMYRLPGGSFLLADPNYPIVFVNDDARNLADLSFCIGTPYFTYAMLDVVRFTEIIEKVERTYRYRSSHEVYSNYFYANTVRKNIDLMDEVASLIGDCPESTVRKRISD